MVPCWSGHWPTHQHAAEGWQETSNNIQTRQGWLSSKTEQHIDSTEAAMTALLQIYVGWSKSFQTDAVKIIKLTIRPIGRCHPRSSSLPNVITGPTVSSVFGTLPGSPFLSECQALSAFRPGSPQWYLTGVLSDSISFYKIGRSHRVPNQGSMVVGG